MFKNILSLFMFAIYPTMAVVIEVNEEQLETMVQNMKKPLVIDFWSEYCSPCLKMKPIFEEISQELDYEFVSINITQNQKAANDFGIRTIPSFKIIDQGEVVGSLVGFMDKANLIENIDNLIHKKVNSTALLAAIQANDVEKVASFLQLRCLDVNQVSLTKIMDMDLSMTPLLCAVSSVIFGDASLDIVTLLLENGADQNLEIDQLGEKITARKLAEQIENENLETEDENLKQVILSFQKRASAVLELFKN
jgi:thioredoxin 1